MTSRQPVSAEKAALRETLLQRRRDRPAAERAAAAAAVAATLVRRLAGVRTLAAYVPDDTEPGAGRLPDVYTQLGARVLLPVVPTEGTTLTWAVDTGRLAPGRFGLLEPVGPRLGASALGAAEVVVTPALAIDRTGTRLGRGRGFYDRALVHVRPDALLVAVVFDDELLDALPVESHDRPIDAVVTPSGGWQSLGSAQPPEH